MISREALRAVLAQPEHDARYWAVRWQFGRSLGLLPAVLFLLPACSHVATWPSSSLGTLTVIQDSKLSVVQASSGGELSPGELARMTFLGPQGAFLGLEPVVADGDPIAIAPGALELVLGLEPPTAPRNPLQGGSWTRTRPYSYRVVPAGISSLTRYLEFTVTTTDRATADRAASRLLSGAGIPQGLALGTCISVQATPRYLEATLVTLQPPRHVTLSVDGYTHAGMAGTRLTYVAPWWFVRLNVPRAALDAGADHRAYWLLQRQDGSVVDGRLSLSTQ